MKLVAFLIVLMSYVQCVSAQQRRLISVIDGASKEPVVKALMIHGSDTIAYTTPQGLAVVPYVKGKVKFVHKEFKTIEFDSDSIPAVVRMRFSDNDLPEVLVLGKMPKIINPWIGDLSAPKLGESHFGIVKTTVEGSTMDMQTVRRKIFGKTRKERKRQRLKEKLEEY